MDPWILHGNVVTFGLEGRETVAWAYSRALAVAARAFGPVEFAWKGRHFWLRGALAVAVRAFGPVDLRGNVVTFGVEGRETGGGGVL